MFQGIQTVKEIKNKSKELLSSIYEESETEVIVDILLEHYLQITRTQLILKSLENVNVEKILMIEAALKRLLNHEPIQYIVGYTHFLGLKLCVDKNVLIPRPETEELVHWLLDEPAIKSSTVNILDIGTGSGCIAISIKKKLSNAKVFAVDISEKALNIATGNALSYNLNIDFIQANILEQDSIKSITGNFHYIISNPPYIRISEKDEMNKNVVDYEPHQALFVDNNNPLVFYTAIANYALSNLHKNGKLFLEINQLLANDVIKLLNTKGFKAMELKKDISGNERMISATL